MMPLHWVLAAALCAALHTLTLWWTAASIRPKRTGPALALVWCGALLRSWLVGAILAAAASHSLHLALLTIATFASTHLVLTRLISQRMIKSEPVLPS